MMRERQRNSDREKRLDLTNPSSLFSDLCLVLQGIYVTNPCLSHKSFTINHVYNAVNFSEAVDDV